MIDSILADIGKQLEELKTSVSALWDFAHDDNGAAVSQAGAKSLRERATVLETRTHELAEIVTDNVRVRLTALEEQSAIQKADAGALWKNFTYLFAKLLVLEEAHTAHGLVTAQVIADAKTMLRREASEQKQKRKRVEEDQAQELAELRTRLEEIARGESIMERIAHKTQTPHMGEHGYVQMKLDSIRESDLACIQRLSEEVARYREEAAQAARERDDMVERLEVTQKDHQRLQAQIAETEEKYASLNKAFCDGDSGLLDHIVLLEEKLAEEFRMRNIYEAGENYQRQVAMDSMTLKAAHVPTH